MIQRIRNWPIHPLLFAAYPVLYLYSQNWREAATRDLLRPLLISLAIAGGFATLLMVASRDRHRGALGTSLVCAAFFTYPFYASIPSFFPIVWILVVLALAALILVKPDLSRFTPPFNAAGIVVVLLPLATFTVQNPDRVELDSTDQLAPLIPTDVELTVSSDRPSPNIYFILPDGYARSDVLMDYYQFDNAPFIEALTEQGFHVARQAPANHTRTLASLTSLLNFVDAKDHVESLGLQNTRNIDIFRAYSAHNRVIWMLEKAGYDTWYLASGAEAYNRIGARHYVNAGLFLTEFETALLNFTPVPAIAPWIGVRDTYSLHRGSLDIMLRRFEALVREPGGPKFVFMHLMCPHPPFLFDAEGNPVEPEYAFANLDGNSLVGAKITGAEYVAGYRGQIQFLNKRLEQSIRMIRTTDPSAVIILQSDHGPGSMMHWDLIEKTNLRERATVLNALYLPGAEPTSFYDTLSPVNTFPIVFNQYFGTQIPLLPDRTYYASNSMPFHFIEVDPIQLQRAAAAAPSE